jgi:undecaprenyl-diphosphatase
MPEWLIAVIMGVVEGVTEFLPISSTGHLIVVGELIGLPENLKNTFEIVIQLGAVIAVIAFYWADLFTQLRTVRQDAAVQQLWLGVLVAFLPAAFFGLLFDDMIEQVLFAPIPIAIALIFGGIVFLIIERDGGIEARMGDAAKDMKLTDITWRQALAIGFFQTLALIPGMSRSGASIVGGLLMGLNRKVATQFSFYLAIPTLGAATLYVLVTNLEAVGSGGLLNLLTGTVVSGIVAWLSIGWLLRFVATNTFVAFGYYRIAVGIVILLVFTLR